MPRNITIPEPMYDRLKNRKEPFKTPTFSAVYQRMLGDIETQPPEEVENWWIEEPLSAKTIKLTNDVYRALWDLQDSPGDDLSFPEMTQWLLDETQSCSDERAVLAADGGSIS